MASTEETKSSSYPYQDANLSIEERVNDLVSRMSLAEKAGQMFHDMIVPGADGQLADGNPAFNIPATEFQLKERHMSHFNLLGSVTDVRPLAEWQNTLQRRAREISRWGIPITLSTDPRNHFSDNPGAAFSAGLLSQWPETLGFAALQSPETVRRFADVARQEYLALGLRVSLHPQIDLATEPRWARIGATFGEDADLTSELVTAYIQGFQGSQLGPQSVATMVKHFLGGGPQKDGEDPHFAYGREQVYPGNNQDYHLKPFLAAIKAGGSQMMPYYGMPVGTKEEEVGFAYNRGIITDLLRKKLGFGGIVCTDWGLITDLAILGQPMPARAWGVEHLTELERVKKILDAGCDQFGGESRPELVIQLVESGRVSETRIDESIRRLLREKFVLGLFDNPYVDVEAAVKLVGNTEFHKEGEAAQRSSYTLLKNDKNLLPLKPLAEKTRRKVYVENINTNLFADRGFEVVDSPDQAEIALLRLRAPFEPRPGGFESFFHASSLEYPAEEQSRQAAIYKAVPTIVDLYLDRPAIIPEIKQNAAALLVNYGSSAEAFLDIVLGVAQPQGKLPFDLPSSTKAVEESRSDVQYDTKNPTFRFGFGLLYPDRK